MAASSSSIPTEPRPGDPSAALQARLAELLPRIDAAIGQACDRYLPDVPPPVSDAIRYALAGGGKRLRGALVIEAFAAAGGSGDAAPLAAAIEIVHAYSLVHDDLPCMDDDDVRRGQPTVHRVFGVAAATRAGIAMVPMAVMAGADAAARLSPGPGVPEAVIRTMMQASGAAGMVGGQLRDLEGEGQAHTLAELELIHAGKTGALLAAAARLGGVAAGASEPSVDALGRYGTAIGLAFQIADDVLDVTATTDQLGKTAGRDLALAKSTYPALLGIAGAMQRAEAVVDDACDALRGAGLLTPALEQLARFTVTRRS